MGDLSMYVCICNAVTERQVYKAIDEGAVTVKALGQQLNVGTQCGACIGCAKECIAKSNKQLPKNVIPINKQNAA